MEEYQALQKARAEAETESAKLRSDLVQAKLGDPSSLVRAVNIVARDAIAIVRFAMANCPPETIRNWPFESLRSIANRIATLPDYTSDDAELAREMRTMAKEAERYAQKRAVEGEPYVAPPDGTKAPTLADLQALDPNIGR